MADESLPSVPVTTNAVVSADDRKKAIAAYYEAKTKVERSSLVKQYPFLSEVFANANHETGQANKMLLAVIGLSILSALLILRAFASSILLGSMVSINGTSNSLSASVGTFQYPVGRMLIQNGGLPSTNDLQVSEQVSIDNVNFFTIATYFPSITNAQTDTWLPPGTNITIYTRCQIVTTQATLVGITIP